MAVDGDGDDMEAQMGALMGFAGFGTTKQKKVQGNNVGAIAKNKVTEYRQYMYALSIPVANELDVMLTWWWRCNRNRPGGFNRALSPS